MVYIKEIKFGENKKTHQHNAGVKLLSSAVFREYGIEISDSDISTGECGKPFFKEFPNIHFNISHCDNAVVCAVDKNVCGVDIEKLRTPNDRVAARLFSPVQLEAYNRLDGLEKSGYFTTLWTLMEAYSKADGRGFVVMKNSPFRISGEKITSAVEDMTFESFYLPQCGCILSICSKDGLIPCFAHDQNPFLF